MDNNGIRLIAILAIVVIVALLGRSYESKLAVAKELPKDNENQHSTGTPKIVPKQHIS